MGMALAGVVLFAFTACTDLAGTRTNSGETMPPGMGLARIRLGAGGLAQSVRTALPDISTYYFTLDFTAPGKTVKKTLDGSETPSLTLTVALEPAVWNLEVNGYEDDSMTNHKVRGNISVPITEGMDASFNVYLAPDFSSGGTGNLDYNISFPATARGWLGLYPIDDTPGTSEEIDISASTDRTGTLSGISEGSYRAVIDLYDSGGNKAAVWTGVAHIYGGATTSLARIFTGTDFIDCPEVIPGATLADKLNAALARPSGSYTIALDGMEGDLASFAPKTFNVTGSNDISITIRGNGKTVQLGSTGQLFYLKPLTSGSSITLVLQDVTLRGIAGNTESLVQLDARGTLEMKAGSLITGNTSSWRSGGVSVYDNGTFTMNGGVVSGNTTIDSNAYGGGGVYVAGGSVAKFTMNGGAVSGNFASGFSGGGVSINGGAVTMSGGAISGNDTSSGGGVSVTSGTFTMSGGAIIFNEAAFGGGVSVSGGTFTMSGGAVSGNNGGFGGVYVYSGSFTMSGGVVSGNISSSSSVGCGGVGVIGGGTFIMSGGAVRGNILSSANGYGREVLLTNGTFKISGNAQPERVFLYNNTRFITISGSLSGETVPIDLGITGSDSITDWENIQILKLDSSYSSGVLATLKDHFTLGKSKRTDGSAAEEDITGYKIDDGGLFVVE
jgi:hypothetical protein